MPCDLFFVAPMPFFIIARGSEGIGEWFYFPGCSGALFSCQDQRLVLLKVIVTSVLGKEAFVFMAAIRV